MFFTRLAADYSALQSVALDKNEPVANFEDLSVAIRMKRSEDFSQKRASEFLA